jgi:2-methylcitrate dehydratase
MALLDGDVTVTQFEKDRWRDSDVMALVEKTSVKPGEALIAKMPVEIIFADSQSLHEIVEIPEGDAERPLSTTSLERKFKKFAIPVIGSAAAEQIVSLVNGLDQLPDTRELTRSAKGEGKQNRF